MVSKGLRFLGRLNAIFTTISIVDMNNLSNNGCYLDSSNCPVSDDGVLQGYGLLTPLDVRDSNIFLDQLQQSFPALQFDHVADCGAGIGRVTKHLLLPRFRHVDLVEQVNAH